MANISDYLETALLNHVFRNTAFSVVTAVYVGLVSNVAVDADMEAGTLTNEITAYTGNRPAVTFGAPSQEDGKATITNTGALQYLLMPAITVKYAIICDGATKSAGNILYYAPLTTPKTTNEGDTFTLPATTGLVLDLA